jgi:hypothetical protein
MSQRGGAVIMRLVEHVQHSTIKPCIEATSAPGTGIDPDEDEI